jgi:hypothetical protein
MRRLTLGVVKPIIAEMLGRCPDSAKVVALINEAQERLLNRPHRALGAIARLEVCVNDACITWPRMVRSIEVASLCNTAMRVRSEWFEFLPNGPGQLKETNLVGLQLIDHGTACVFADVRGASSKVRVTCDLAADNGSKVLLQGYDQNGNWILTNDGGNWIEGEYVTASVGGTNSVNTFAPPGPVRVIKPETDGPIRLYEWDTLTSAITRSLAVYEPSEVLPIYRRSFIPGLSSLNTCSGSSDPCDKKRVVVLARLQHVPVSKDNDFLVLNNIAAIKEMVKSIVYAEQDGKLQEAEVHEIRARREIEGESSAYLGDGAQNPIGIASSNDFGIGYIGNVI